MQDIETLSWERGAGIVVFNRLLKLTCCFYTAHLYSDLTLTPPTFSITDHFSEPWLHVTYFFLGGYIGQRWVRLEKELVVDINEIRADKGMAPMVATEQMLGLKYRTQADFN